MKVLKVQTRRLCGRNSDRGRRAGVDARYALHVDIAAAVAVVALDLSVFLVLLVATLGGYRRRRLLGGFRLGFGWCRPPRYLPDDASETLEPEAALGPLAAWLARPIKGSETSVDSTLVGLGAQLVCGGAGRSRVDSTVLPTK